MSFLRPIFQETAMIKPSAILNKPKPVKRVQKEEYQDSKFLGKDKKGSKKSVESTKKVDDRPKKKSSLSGGSNGPKPKDSPQFDRQQRKKKRVFAEEEDTTYEDDAPPMPVKKASRELAVLQNRDQLPVTAEEHQALESRFGESTDTIIKMLDFGNTDGAISLINKSLLQTMVSILPIAENAVRKTQGARGVYQFNQLITQVRELLNDLQSLRDKGLLGQSIVERHVRPSFMDIAVQIVIAFTELEASARSKMKSADFAEYKEDLNRTKAGLASFIQTQYKDVSDSVVSSLS